MNASTQYRRLACLLLVTAAVGVGAFTGDASAQAVDPTKKAEVIKPPTPTKPDDPPTVMNYLAMAVVFALVAGASLIPSKRGHQD